MMRGLWFHRRLRRYLVQGLFLAALAAFLAVAIVNVHGNLTRQGMAYGWDFLWRPTGWKLSTSMLDQGLGDPYWWTILMGAINTLVLGLAGIVLASILGCALGLMRVSASVMLRGISTVYVDLLRNVPAIMQIFFWYEICRHAPAERQALSLGGLFFLSNRGFYLPAIQSEIGYGPLLAGSALLAFAVFHLVRRGHRSLALLAVTFAAALCFVWPGGLIHLQPPVFQGFGFRGGHRVPIEFLVLMIAISIYSSAYIAEIIRGSLLAVDKGQSEAGYALGLKPSTIFWRIRFPLAMRSALPPLSNQYLITMKVTSLGAAIGYADLFSVVSSSINHAGQTIELLGVLMASYLAINYAMASLMGALNDHLALKRHGSPKGARVTSKLLSWAGTRSASSKLPSAR